MKYRHAYILTTLLIFFFLPINGVSKAKLASGSYKKVENTKVCFTPEENCTKLIVEELNNAKSEILVQAYSFTSEPIAKALLEAFNRGVKVKIILDKSQKTAKYSALSFFIKLGIPTYIDDKHAIAHNKIIIIESKILMTGSFNFTKAAQEKNAENLIVIKDTSIVRKFVSNWTIHFNHSKVYYFPN